ncbi:N-acetylmuramidase domain-containing protein [Sphingopyxis sp. 113P3]|uniref:N-acetylmuramidase domain-containing protein n=1 Tax=Sphingopyxis sp. (strain 113P3) TaxID=292913 RepID=UPI0006AD2210|nr:N-acetylmuramidase domain-containing protein [Sphingopyxis sp. 113P3]ALC11202.1 hypothetical protein LH20_04475 [Sphingopyxis sp. 113P3]
MNLRDLQMWLNVRGANLVVDGLRGPSTRKAILDTFINRSAPAVTPAEIAQIAARLGGSPRQLAAVAKVESAGGGWDNQGRLKCLYERHYFWRRMQVIIPLLSNPTPGGYTIDADGDGINDSWEKVADAAMRSPLAAFESASWGKFQIMGAHAKSLGYGNAVEFVWALSRSEKAHYEALARFIETNGLTKAFRALSTNPDDCRAFAKGYNGTAYEKGGYHRKLAEAMR